MLTDNFLFKDFKKKKEKQKDSKSLKKNNTI